jgi:hypothetical protein
MVFLAIVLLLVALAIVGVGACVVLAPESDDPVVLQTRDQAEPTGWRYQTLRSDPRRLAAPAFIQH